MLLFSLILLIFNLLFATNNADWKVVSTMPVPVKGAQAVVYNDLIYVIGGYTDSTYSSTNLIQVFDPQTNVWQVLNDTLKIPRYGFCADNYRNSVLMFGGDVVTDSTLEMWDFMNTTYIYDSKNIFNRQFATCQVIDNYLYMFGGIPGSNLFNLPYLVEYYVPGARVTYSRASSLNENEYPNNRTDIVQQMSAVAQNYIFLFGGALNGILNSIYRYDVTNHDFTKLNITLLTSRSAGAAVTLNNRDIIVIGGYNESTPALGTTEHLTISFGGEILSIQNLGFLQIPRAELCAVTYHDSLIYVFGGTNLLGDCVEEVEVLNFTAGTTPINMNDLRLPQHIKLFPNYPNPFNNQTLISFAVPYNSFVRLTIYDITGKKIKSLVQKNLSTGIHKIHWNGIDEQGRSVPSGIYFCQLQIGNSKQTQRLILMR